MSEFFIEGISACETRQQCIEELIAVTYQYPLCCIDIFIIILNFEEVDFTVHRNVLIVQQNGK